MNRIEPPVTKHALIMDRTDNTSDGICCAVDEAAAPHSSFASMFSGAGLVVFPPMLIYTAINCRVFRSKVGVRPAHN
jgi:hypothetical protein